MVDKNPDAPRGAVFGLDWPSWRYGPNGQAKVFYSAEDVPEGWTDHPHKLKAAPKTPAPLAQPKQKLRPSHWPDPPEAA